MLAIDRVSKTYPDGTKALTNLSLSVGDGEIAVLLGSSGCGKTSLLRIIAGLEAASAGAVTLDGATIAGPHPSIGLVFQEPRLLPWLNAAQNVEFGLTGLTAVDRKRRVDAILERVGIVGQSDKLPRELSGGQQQRVALARALVTKPRVLLLDEPFSALDAMTREGLQDHLLELWAVDAPTIVMVTHDIDEAAVLADRIAVLKPNPGRLSRHIVNPLGRPRERDGAAFLSLKRELRGLLGEASLEGAPPLPHLPPMAQEMVG